MTARTTTVVFKAGASMTLAFEPGDAMILSAEEAQRAIAAGHAVPGQLVIHSAPKPRSRRKKKGAKS